jgi:lysophospholipase L1-like esterase
MRMNKCDANHLKSLFNKTQKNGIMLYSLWMKIFSLILFLLLLGVSGPYTGECMAETDKNQKKDLVVVIGASYAKGWSAEELGGMAVVNKGINGEQSFEMLARFERDVIMLNPRAVIIWGFINDFFRSSRADIDVTIKKTKDNIIRMIKEAKNHNIIPVLATEVTITGQDSWSERFAGVIGWLLGKESYQDYINKHVVAVNEWISEIAARNDYLVLDLKSVLADEKGVRKRKYAAPDGSHISLEGYEAINNYANEVLGDYFNHK